jgi:hypothetical protein
MALGGIIHIPNFMTIDSGIQVILRLLSQKFEAEMLVLLMGDIYGLSR